MNYREILIREYVIAFCLKDTCTRKVLERIFNDTTGMPTVTEFATTYRAVLGELEAVAKAAPTPYAPAESGAEMPAAFADFIEQELDLSAFDQPAPPRYRAGDKVLYWHTASRTWLEGEINWVYQHGGVGEYRYSVRVRFPNGKHRAVGRVTLAKLKPQE